MTGSARPAVTMGITARRVPTRYINSHIFTSPIVYLHRENVIVYACQTAGGHVASDKIDQISLLAVAFNLHTRSY